MLRNYSRSGTRSTRPEHSSVIYYGPRLPSGGQDINGLVRLLPLARDVGPPIQHVHAATVDKPAVERGGVSGLLGQGEGANSRRRRIGAIERCGR